MDISRLIIRDERAGDEATVHMINQAAFGREEEADLVDVLRATSDSLISLVASVEERVVGHILFSPVTVGIGLGPAGAMGLGPVAVLPDYQRRSIGSHLIDDGLRRCRETGYQAVFVLGHPEYYPRFGFRPAAEVGLYYKNHDFDPYFFVIELVPGSVVNLSGEVCFLPPFDDA
jgi:putative acetyltransferase